VLLCRLFPSLPEISSSSATCICSHYAHIETPKILKQLNFWTHVFLSFQNLVQKYLILSAALSKIGRSNVPWGVFASEPHTNEDALVTCEGLKIVSQSPHVSCILCPKSVASSPMAFSPLAKARQFTCHSRESFTQWTVCSNKYLRYPCVPTCGQQSFKLRYLQRGPT
jgi:hypothetical protein